MKSSPQEIMKDIEALELLIQKHAQTVKINPFHNYEDNMFRLAIDQIHARKYWITNEEIALYESANNRKAQRRSKELTRYLQDFIFYLQKAYQYKTGKRSIPSFLKRSHRPLQLFFEDIANNYATLGEEFTQWFEKDSGLEFSKFLEQKLLWEENHQAELAHKDIWKRIEFACQTRYFFWNTLKAAHLSDSIIKKELEQERTHL